MKNKNNPFEHLIQAYLTRENSEHLNGDELAKETELVFNKKYNASLSPDKVNQLISSLSQALAEDSLGTLVAKNMNLNNATVFNVEQEINMPASLLNEIREDSIYANSIPIKSLIKLLKFLNIPLEKALQAIETTFKRLSIENKLLNQTPAIAQPVYRKSIESGIDSETSRLKANKIYLFQNKESLEKYTNRLKELFEKVELDKK